MSAPPFFIPQIVILSYRFPHGVGGLFQGCFESEKTCRTDHS